MHAQAALEAVLQDHNACVGAEPAKVRFTLESLVSRAKAAALLTLVLYSVPVSLFLTAVVLLLEWVRIVRSGRTRLLWKRLQRLSSRPSPRGTALVSGAHMSALPSSPVQLCGKLNKAMTNMHIRDALQTSLNCAGAKSTKGLHVCRHLHRAGWRVVLVDTHKCVADVNACYHLDRKMGCLRQAS